MPKKHVPGEELFEDAEPVPIVEETPKEVSADTVAPPAEAPAPMETPKVDVCKCGATMVRSTHSPDEHVSGPEISGIRLTCPSCGYYTYL